MAVLELVSEVRVVICSYPWDHHVIRGKWRFDKPRMTWWSVRSRQTASQAESIATNKRLHDGNSSPLDSLSEREREVLQLVAEGHTNQAIADKLFLSVKTVESYRSRLMTKLGLRSRVDLMRFAIDTGLLTSNPAPPPELS